MSGWGWWVGGGGVAVAAFVFVSRFFGWKLGAIAAVIVGGLAFWKGSMTRAERRGHDAQEAKAKAIAEEQTRRAAEARQREIDRQHHTGGAINERDPYLRD
jgi:hypothetical protein